MDPEDIFNNTLLNETIFGGDGDPVFPVGGVETNATSVSSPGYCGNSLRSLSKSYRTVHGYTSLMVCLFGAQANILNLIVLTRRDMINPTNAILTGLALADLLNMLEYIPYAVYMIVPGSKTTYAWALFVLIHSNFAQVCHTISIWLTVTLAVWRYIMVAMHTKCKTLCSMSRAKWAIGSAYVTSPILCIPIYLSFSLTPLLPLPGSAEPQGAVNATTSPDSTWNQTANFSSARSSTSVDPKYIVNLSDLAKSTPLLMTANFWLYSVVIKIIPCILLTVVSLRLINSLMEAKKRKEILLKKRNIPPVAAAQVGCNHPPGENPTPQPRRGGGDHAESGGSDRTTRMLLAILLLFLITEFPQGLLGLLSGVLGDAFFKSCYIPLADLMDFVALLNSAINFILYCAMSKKFRDTFTQVFHLNRLLKWGRRQRSGLGGTRRSSGGRVHAVATLQPPVVSISNNHANHLESQQDASLVSTEAV